MLDAYEPKCFIEAQQIAYRHGEAAFSKGLPCDPTQDDEIAAYCMCLTIEESAKVMEKWRRGWERQQSLKE